MGEFPFVVLKTWHHNKHAMHLVMAESAEFGAGDFVLAGAVGANVEGNYHTGDDVLFSAEFPNEEIMHNIAGMQQQANITPRGNAESGGNDVILAAGVRRIDANGVAPRVGDEFVLNVTENVIPTGIVEIPAK